MGRHLTPAWLGAFALCLLLTVALVLPLLTLVLRSLAAASGDFTLANYAAYLTMPGLAHALVNTAILGVAEILLVLPLAFAFAYGLERVGLRFEPILTTVASLPLLVPSLLPALALIYLFGRQGLITPLVGGEIYGFKGVLLADAIAAFPHALIILRTALASGDERLYEQARILGASPWRMFRTITLPGAWHGIVSASLVIFALTIADIGAPLVVGGNFEVLSIVIYKQVLGQQQFELGAVAALLLMLPSVAAIVFERMAARRKAPVVSTHARRLRPAPQRLRDGAIGTLCWAIAGAIVTVLCTCQFVAVVRLWPYDLSLTSMHYALDRYDGGGWVAVADSILLAVLSAGLGTALAFTGACVAERTRAGRALRAVFSRLAVLPAAVPGLALGLGYVFFFDDPANPLQLLYGSVALLVLANITHFYTVAHLTAVSAVRVIDPELESAAAMLGRSPLSVFLRVIAPISAPALVEIALYLFVNAMTTVSVVMFLYPPHFKLASVAVLNMDDAGDLAPAAAMGMMIFYVNVAARLAAQGAFAFFRRPAPPPILADTPA